MSDIDAKAFAANLRAEMGRMGYKPTLQRLCDLWFEAFPKSDQVYHQNWLARIIDGQDAPSNIVPEVEALANALGCPIERLTVSREELEAALVTTRDHFDAGKNGHYTLGQWAERMPGLFYDMIRSLRELGVSLDRNDGHWDTKDDPADWAEESVYRAATKRRAILEEQPTGEMLARADELEAENLAARHTISDLTAEVERISVERDHYREENARLRERCDRLEYEAAHYSSWEDRPQ
jgi:hypothetical protein